MIVIQWCRYFVQSACFLELEVEVSFSCLWFRHIEFWLALHYHFSIRERRLYIDHRTRTCHIVFAAEIFDDHMIRILLYNHMIDFLNHNQGTRILNTLPALVYTYLIMNYSHKNEICLPNNANIIVLHTAWVIRKINLRG